MIFLDNFIGYDTHEVSESYLDEDNQEEYLKNCSKLGPSWEYIDYPIEYKFNKLGHRSIDVEDLNFDDYILFTGCSHTGGVGLALHDTYPDILSKKMNCNYYNLAVKGSGIDVLFHNLSVWFSRYKKPKLLVVQWPDWSRFVILKGKNFIPHGSWSDREHMEFIIKGNDLDYFYTRSKLTHEFIKSLNIPFINVGFGNLKVIENLHNCVYVPKIDLARDLAHYGKQSHLQAAESCFEYRNMLPLQLTLGAKHSV